MPTDSFVASQGNGLAADAATVAHTPHDVARAQRAEWAASVCEALPTLAVDGDGKDALATLATALAGTELAWEAIAWTEGLAAADSPERVGDLLGQAAQRGLRVAVAVPNSRLLPESAARHSLGRREAERLAEAIGGDVVAVQYLAEGSLLEPAGEPGAAPAARVRRDLIGDPDDAVAWLVAAGAPVTAGAAEGTLTFAPSGLAYLTRLERANDELTRANARLARAHLGVHDAAAASVVARFEAQLAAAEARNEALEAENKGLAERLGSAVEVARQNDEYFQAARAKLLQRHHRVAEGLYRRSAPLRWIARGGRPEG